MSYLIVSAALLGIGVYGLSVKRNAIRILFAVEVIVNAANLNFAVFYVLHEPSPGFGPSNRVLFNSSRSNGSRSGLSVDSSSIQIELND